MIKTNKLTINLMNNLDALLKQIQLKPINETHFIGESDDLLKTGRIYGGQVLGQSIMAASYTVDRERPIHSMHSYFIRPGNPFLPIEFQVDKIRDGGSFSIRRVLALQDSKPIYHMSCSFQKPEVGFEHSNKKPLNVLPPEQCFPESHFAEAIQNNPKYNPRATGMIFDKPIQILYPDGSTLGEELKEQADYYVWIKASAPVKEDPLLHKGLLSYVTDYYFIFTALLTHGVSPFDLKMQMASLDHAIWFHRPFSLNEWLLYTSHSPNASAGRGLVHGEIFDTQGHLVASVSQEGLMRLAK